MAEQSQSERKYDGNNVDQVWYKRDHHDMKVDMLIRGVPEFLNLWLASTGSIVAGSFVLKSVDKYHGEWQPDDLDVWVPASIKIEPLLNLLVRQFGYQKSIRYSLELNEYGRFCKEVRNVTTLIHPDQDKIKIQLIHLRSPCDPKDMVKGFDLTICRYFYDGFSVYQYGEPLLQPATFTKESIFKQNCYEQFRSLKRILKYKERGYKVDFPKHIMRLISWQFMGHRFPKPALKAWNRVAKESQDVPFLFSYDGVIVPQ